MNSGFESDSPDIAVPQGLAKRILEWPPRSAMYVSVDTGGGEAEFVMVESGLLLELEGRRLTVNVLINPYIDEVLLSDYVISALGIVILNAKVGLWRFIDDPPDIIRGSVKPRYWR